MERQDLEEVLLTRSFLLKSGECIRCNSSSIVEPQGQGSSGSITFMLVFSTLVAVCGSYVFGHAVGYSSPAQSGIMEDLGLTTEEYSVFSSILSIGAMLGAVLSGRIADLIGRRAGMGIAQIFCLSGWLAIAFSEVAWSLDLGRFLLGCGMGLLSFSVPIYIAEITPKNVRGGFTALNPLLMGFGQSLAFLIGSLVNWRTLALIGIIPGLIQLPCLFFIPESPRWLVKVGREKEFEAALCRFRGANADIFEEATEIQEYTLFLQQIREDGIFNLFQRKYMLLLTVGVGLMAFQRFGGLYAFLFYASSIFESAGFSSTIGSIAAAVVQMVGTALGALLVDKCGRRPMLLVNKENKIPSKTNYLPSLQYRSPENQLSNVEFLQCLQVSAVGSCTGCILTGLAFLFQDLHFGKDLSAILVFFGVLFYLGFLQLGLGGIPWIIMSEIFPINIKGAAGSLVILVSWIGSWVISYTYSALFEWSSVGTFFIYGCICAAGIVFIAILVPETKGRTLEEIQESLICTCDQK
ncbi:hypothetical protein CRYUN_Cryun08bG0017900 [Craigia yunnanensis]